ncbi:MAG: hypothetical protein BM557_02745 [Flavobacterium sp. MedPE-SWcel]|uniref:RNA polymerase sigma factor n=1 Tax=uncultured Flavobacterium sp. TaxID=165435 RepID=UPI0009191EBA|nr:sigma-70 family RNA polymerase sigma factor [uncultured Flavobacterium sp.]OIQ21732.1 MAG: hypothetical protein BM557_02745 [Flavobacterium sp. MedPE-SWcel]
MIETDLINGCKKQDRRTQQLVYNRYGAKVLGICRRYMKDRERAEEMVMNTFLSVFQKIDQYNNKGSFEGWILRITVNYCLSELRKKTNFNTEISHDIIQLSDRNNTLDSIDREDIEKMLATLPESARIIFNMHAIEGYKHKEIAEQLNISEGTSKSQLNYAKEKLKKTFFTEFVPKTKNS